MSETMVVDFGVGLTFGYCVQLAVSGYGNCGNVLVDVVKNRKKLGDFSEGRRFGRCDNQSVRLWTVSRLRSSER